ncbi:MAG: hypothetical protein ACK4KW_14385 [Gemmobacter sp.]
MCARPLLSVAVAALALAGCDRLPRLGERAAEVEVSTATEDTPRPRARPGDGQTAAIPAALAPQGARTAAALDTTSEADRAAARAAPVAGDVLGEVVVSLGNPVEQGFWLRSGLVTAPRAGTARLASGATVRVDLLPLAGGGPQMSLAAYRALGLRLTELPTVTVLAR